MARLPPPITLERDEARAFLVGHHGLARPHAGTGPEATRALLRTLRCIQLDPLDPWGTNADLVALARLDGLRKGDLFRHVYPGHAFEHFAKERCLLPAEAFPFYRSQAAQTPWWRLGERLRKVSESLILSVLDEVRERGPLPAAALADRGRVEPIDWAGWKSTAKVASMALEVLWTRCEVVVCGRGPAGRLYDVPERALPRVAGREPGEFARWALSERLEAAGLLTRTSGPLWSMLSDVRTSALPDALVEEGLAEEVRLAGSPRRYLAPAGFRRRSRAPVDDRMRLLGPLDPLLWDRALVRDAFGFDYVWEVYKPAETRRWGWYVCPLLHRGRLVGRVEGALEGDVLKVRKLWAEPELRFDEDAFDEAMARHAAACGAARVRRPTRVLRG